MAAANLNVLHMQHGTQTDLLLLNFLFRVGKADFLSQESENVRSEQRKVWKGEQEHMKIESIFSRRLNKEKYHKAKFI